MRAINRLRTTGWSRLRTTGWSRIRTRLWWHWRATLRLDRLWLCCFERSFGAFLETKEGSSWGRTARGQPGLRGVAPREAGEQWGTTFWEAVFFFYLLFLLYFLFIYLKKRKKVTQYSCDSIWKLEIFDEEGEWKRDQIVRSVVRCLKCWVICTVTVVNAYCRLNNTTKIKCVLTFTVSKLWVRMY